MQLYVFNLTVKLFLSLNGKTSQQKEKNNVPLALIAIYTQTHSKTANERPKFIRIIQEYLQPKVGRKIRIFSMGQKNNILIKRKECMAPQAMNDDESPGRRK